MITKTIHHGTETPHYAANDYCRMKGGKGIMPLDLAPAVEAFRPWVSRAMAEGCCGHPDGPTWSGARWICRFAPPEGCCQNAIDAFVREFENWLERGAPLHEGEDNGD